MARDRPGHYRRVGGTIFALAVGISIALFSYRWITDPQPRAERVAQERVVLSSRELLTSKVGVSVIEIVDPLSPNRKVGKVYVYREELNWAISGYYRRDENDRWHPYLMTMNADLDLIVLKTSDDLLVERAATDPNMTVL